MNSKNLIKAGISVGIGALLSYIAYMVVSNAYKIEDVLDAEEAVSNLLFPFCIIYIVWFCIIISKPISKIIKNNIIGLVIGLAVSCVLGYFLAYLATDGAYEFHVWSRTVAVNSPLASTATESGTNGVTTDSGFILLVIAHAIMTYFTINFFSKKDTVTPNAATRANIGSAATRPAVNAAPSDAAKPMGNTVFCPKCGTKLPSGSKFCSKCGASVISDQQSNGQA